jgi:hypothetical protein
MLPFPSSINVYINLISDFQSNSHIDMASQPKGNFRLLDLPMELRLILYELLPVTSRHCTLKFPPQNSFGLRMREMAITLVIRSLPVALLATCKLIKKEATPILERKLNQLRTGPMRLIVDSPLLSLSLGRQGLLNKTVLHHLECIRYNDAHVGVDEKEVRRVIERLRDRSTRALKMPVQREPLCNFIRECALYLYLRKPSATHIAVTRHPDQDIEHLCDDFVNTIAWMHGWDTFVPFPIGFMLRGDICDEFDDPHTRAKDEGPIRRSFKEAFTIFGDSTFQIEDIPDHEFDRVWGEGRHNYIE